MSPLRLAPRHARPLFGRHGWLALALPLLLAMPSGPLAAPPASAHDHPASSRVTTGTSGTSLSDNRLRWPGWNKITDTLLLRQYNTRIVLLGTILLGIGAGTVGTFMLLRKRSLVGDVVSHASLPGIAIVWNPTPFPRSGDEANLSPPCLYLKPPPPILVPFEPIELSERDPRIAAICDVDTSNGESRSVPSTRWPLSYARTLGIFALLATALFVSAALGIALSFSESTLWIALLLAVPSVITMVLLGIRGHWFLVPRGVVIRSTFMRVSLRRYAPSDSVLIVYPLPPGWGATLFQGSRQSGRFLSRRECIALLRVWQCPRPTPAIEIMDDLK